jgi:hypothetical protein
MLNRILKRYLNKKGFVSIYAVLLIAFLLPFLMFSFVDVNHFMQQNRKLKNIVDNAAASAVTMVDNTQIPKGIIQITDTDAINIATGIVKQDLFLNNDLTPQSKSILSGKPDLRVYVVNNAPTNVTTPLDTVNAQHPSVIVYGKFPVKGLFFSSISVNITAEGMSQVQFK